MSHDARPGPAALLISESGATDRNGDNAVAGPVGNMRQLAELLSDRGDRQPALRQGRHRQDRPRPLRAAARRRRQRRLHHGAKAAVRFLADQPGTDKARISVYALGEGTIHAMALATDTGPTRQDPLAGAVSAAARPLPRHHHRPGARRREARRRLSAWSAAVDEVRTRGTAPAKLPEGLGAILNPGNVKAVVEADAIDPLALAAKVPAGTPVLLTCSDSDGQANCDAEQPLIAALKHTALTVVELKGVNHVLRDDPTDNVANYAKKDPLSPQLVTALDDFVTSSRQGALI